MTDEHVRVLLVDDHAIVRKGIRALLEEVEDVEVVAEAGSGHEQVGDLVHEGDDVLVLDPLVPAPPLDPRARLLPRDRLRHP